MTNPQTITCAKCGSKMELITGSRTDLCRGEAIFVEKVTYFQCPGEYCDGIQFTQKQMDNFDDQLREAYRNKHNLLSPEEVKSIREDLCLSQEQFAKMTFIDEGYLIKLGDYAYVQSKQEDIILRAVRDVPGFSRFLLEQCREGGQQNGIRLA